MGRREQAAEVAAKRRTGPSPARSQEILDHMHSQEDLRGQCRACGAVRRGTLAEITTPCPECGHGS